VVSSTPRPHFTPGKDPVPILQENVWAPGPVWTGGKSRPHLDSIPDRTARSSVRIATELPDPHTHTHTHTYIYIYNADTGLTTNEQWTYFGQWLKAFPFSKTSRPDVRPTQLPIQWLQGGGGREGGSFYAGHGADYSLPSSAKVKNAWSCISTPSHAFVTPYLIEHRDFS